MNKAHMLCILLPLLLAAPGMPSPMASPELPGDNQLQGICHALMLRVQDGIRAGVLLADELGLAWIVGGDR
jgi:hypothetical protein